jgi:hypothetical protein
MYQLGEAVPRDHTEAAKWLHRAADQGLALAQFVLGGMYVNGQGVPEDVVRAHMRLDLSAARTARITGAQKLARDAGEMRDALARKMTAQVEDAIGAEVEAEARTVAQSSNRTCGFPASGSPTGFTARHTTASVIARRDFFLRLTTQLSLNLFAYHTETMRRFTTSRALCRARFRQSGRTYQGCY